MLKSTCRHHFNKSGHLVQMHELANSLMLDDWRAEKLFGQPRVKPAAEIGSVRHQKLLGIVWLSNLSNAG